MIYTKFYVITDKTQVAKIEDPSCFLITKEGIMMKRTNAFFDSITGVSGVSFLAEIEEECTLKKGVSKIPYLLIEQAMGFFMNVYKEHQSEAIVLLLHKDGVYELECPEQEVSAGALEYSQAESRKEGWAIVGTIHSHGSMSAFHSGVDDADEEDFDGIHITIGNVNTYPTISCSIVAGGVRTKLDQDVIIEGIEQKVFNKKWLKKVKKKAFGGYYGNLNTGVQQNLYQDSQIEKQIERQVNGHGGYLGNRGW